MQPQHTQKLTIFILFLAILSVALYAVLKSKKKKQNTNSQLNFDTSTGGNTGATNGGASTSNPLFPLKTGSRGKYVKALQKGINKNYFATLSEDGIFGNNTLAAVKKYLDHKYKLKPSEVGVAWSVFQKEGFEKYL